MNPEKWDAIAEAYLRGEFVPANGWDAWNAQAAREAEIIREALPDTVQKLVEIGCGVGRLTPYLAIVFPRVLAIDTSPACRKATRRRTASSWNVKVLPPDNPYVAGDAALVWGNLYDEDWSAAEVRAHRAALRLDYPLVLEGTPERWMLWSSSAVTTFEA